MRVVHVTDCFLPGLGGIEVLVADLVTHQRASGLDARVLTTQPAAQPAPGLSTGEPRWVHRCPTAGASALARSLEGAGVAGRALDELGPDVVHAHLSVLSPFALAVVRQAVRRGVPTVVTAHSLWAGLPAGLPWLASAGLQLRAWPVRWTAVSGVAADSLRAFLGPHTPVGVLPNAVDVDRWAALGARSPAPVPTVVSVMRLARRKRPVPLVRMLRSVRDAIPPGVPIRAVLVGDGPQWAAVTGYLSRHRMTDWVELTGRLDRTGIGEVLARSSLYVSPAPLESFGLAALEARCAGLPVVASARSGVRDFIRDGHDGRLVEGDAQMAAALAELLTRPTLLDRLATQARSSRPDLGWDGALLRAQAAYAEAAAISAVGSVPVGMAV